MKNSVYSLLVLLGLFSINIAEAQCPQITCPDNVIMDSEPDNCGATLIYATPVGSNPCGEGGGELTTEIFDYSGDFQIWTVPVGVSSIDFDLIAASGGWSDNDGADNPNHVPGNGGRLEGTIAVNAGDVLYIYVGGEGTDATFGIGGTGGFNGGGNSDTNTSYSGGGGGGASDIRLNGTALSNRIIIAGGGGGAAWNYAAGDNGGAGGNLIGANGETQLISTDVACGIGGTQSAGGTGGQWSGWNAGTNGELGIGGNGAIGTSGGGAGGGYYGGGGGSWAGGGGGSSFEGTSFDIAHTQGYQDGNGMIAITYIAGGPTTTELTSGLGSGSFFPVGISTETYTVTDELGNTATCSFTINVTDAGAPEIICPDDIITGTDEGYCSAVVNYSAPLVNDACSFAFFDIVSGLSSGSEFFVGDNEVVLIAEDTNGNTATCSFEITVLDDQSPGILCPDDILVYADDDACEAVVTYISPLGTTSCLSDFSDNVTFDYSGDFETFTVPAGVNQIEFDLIGAPGGICDWNGDIQLQQIPGNGGRMQGVINVVPGDVLYIYVGGMGENATAGFGGIGGFNGGGTGGTTGVYSGGGGGGSSDIRLNGTSLANRVAIAGGGGGSAYNYSAGGDNGGDGGGLIGLNGESDFNADDVSVGEGGTQDMGGLAGQYPGYDAGTDGELGLGGTGASGTSGGGGGAGYYGGGGGSWSGGGGGSSFEGTGSDIVHTQGYNAGPASVVLNFEINEVITTELVSGLGSGSSFPTGTTTETYMATDGEGNTVMCSFDITVVSVINTITVVGNVLTADLEDGTYQWIDCDNNFIPVFGATNQSYVANDTGSYACIISNGFCTDTTDCTTNAFVGIETFASLEIPFNIYPNPSAGIVNIDLDKTYDTVEVLIKNIQGQTIRQESLRNEDQFTLDIQEVESGLYLVQITLDMQTFIYKIIKE